LEAELSFCFKGRRTYQEDWASVFVKNGRASSPGHTASRHRIPHN